MLLPKFLALIPFLLIHLVLPSPLPVPSSSSSSSPFFLFFLPPLSFPQQPPPLFLLFSPCPSIYIRKHQPPLISSPFLQFLILLLSFLNSLSSFPSQLHHSFHRMSNFTPLPSAPPFPPRCRPPSSPSISLSLLLSHQSPPSQLAAITH